MIRDKQRQAAPKPGARMALSAAAAIVLAALRFGTDGRPGRRQRGLGAEDLAGQGRLQLLPWLGRRRQLAAFTIRAARRRSALRNSPATKSE